MQKMKINKNLFDYATISILVLLVCSILLSSLFFNFLDSDSGGEIKRSILFNISGFDGGPLITQVIYSLLLSIANIEQAIIIISLLNIILFLGVIIFSVKFCKEISGGITKSKEYILVLTLLSIFSFTSLIYYIKPYLLAIFFVILGLFYFAKYNSNNNKNFLIISSILFSIAILSKNHTYPFVAFPFLFLGLKYFKQKKINLKEVAYFILPTAIILIPYILFQINLFGLKFWHFPNSWYFSSGLNSYIAQYFWNYPLSWTIPYYNGQWNFLLASFPLALISLILIFCLWKNKTAFKMLTILILLAFLPYLVGIIPFYQQYNYFLSVFLVLSFVISIGYLPINRDTKIIIYTIIIIASLSLFVSNFQKVYDLNSKEKDTIREFREFESLQNETPNIIFSRDFKLQPYSDKFLFITPGDLNKEDLLGIIGDTGGTNNLNKSLNDNRICYLLFYTDVNFNQNFYNIISSFIGTSFSMDKYEKSQILKKVYNGNKLIVFKKTDCKE